MRALCLASLFKWCVSTTIFFPACEVVNRLSESHRLQLNLYFHWFYRILCSQTDQAYVTDADGLYMHNTFFYCLWCVRSWSGCRNLICYSCTCLFVDLIGLSVPREITLLWQMLMNFLFVFYLYYWWYGTIVVLAWHVQTKPGFSDRNVCHLVTLSVHAYILSI